jgi:ABC-type nitrate/sulfonate/bicarbonate transport system ATPase subunit
MITVHELCKRFGEHVVFDRFSCQIPLDGNTVLRGASGSGKTTLLRMLAGLLTPDSGEIRGLDGLYAAFVFQEDRLLPWYTAEKNVALVSDVGRASTLLGDLGLGEALREKPAALSGGMKRRVAIARALAFQSDMLLLDEPFAGLDDDAKRRVAEALHASGLPIIAAVHSDEESALLKATTILRI